MLIYTEHFNEKVSDHMLFTVFIFHSNYRLRK